MTKKDKAFIEERNQIIRARHARGLRHKELWYANTAKTVAEDMGLDVNALREAVRLARPYRGITQDQIDEATPRIREGERHKALYKADSAKQIGLDWGVGNFVIEKILAGPDPEADDPVRKFLTMRLTG